RRSVEGAVWLEDSQGVRIENAILGLRSGLWSPDHKRLTLLMDPGRVKTGLTTNVNMGLALEPGKTVHLVIGGDARNAYGLKMGSRYRKSYQVTISDNKPPHPRDWQIDKPKANTRQPLVIQFTEPIDHALAQTQIHLTDGEGNVIEGEFRSKNYEQGFSFLPKSVWQQGKHHLVVDARLEDTAANSVRGVFDKNQNDHWLPAEDRYVRRSIHITELTP
ncbi:MAG: hypothetical protein AAF202_11805, partial [Pseudomonadota bacterium]